MKLHNSGAVGRGTSGNVSGIFLEQPNPKKMNCNFLLCISVKVFKKVGKPLTLQADAVAGTKQLFCHLQNIFSGFDNNSWIHS